MNHIQHIEDSKEKLFRETGHELLEPANQYCKHCGEPMFIKERSSLLCKGIHNERSM